MKQSSKEFIHNICFRYSTLHCDSIQLDSIRLAFFAKRKQWHSIPFILLLDDLIKMALRTSDSVIPCDFPFANSFIYFRSKEYRSFSNFDQCTTSSTSLVLVGMPIFQCSFCNIHIVSSFSFWLPLIFFQQITPSGYISS